MRGAAALRYYCAECYTVRKPAGQISKHEMLALLQMAATVLLRRRIYRSIGCLTAHLRLRPELAFYV